MATSICIVIGSAFFILPMSGSEVAHAFSDISIQRTFVELLPLLCSGQSIRDINDQGWG